MLLIAPFFQLELLVNIIPIMGKAYTLWQLLAGAAFLLVLVKNKAGIRDFSWIHLLFAALLLVITAASIGNPDASLKRAVQYSYGSLAVGLFVEYGIRKDRDNFLTGMEVFFGSLVALNVATILLFPKGMYAFERALEENWLLGYKNYHIVYIMALLVFSTLNSLCRTGKIGIRVWLWILLSAFSSILVAARTPLMAIALFAAAVLCRKLLDFTRVFNALVYLGAATLLFLAIVVIRLENLPVIGRLLEGREITFNSRTFFWDKAMKEFWEYPVFGHGYQQFRMFRGYVTTHNQIIEVLYKAGIVGCVIFVLILVLAAVKLFQNREGECTKYLSVLYAGFLVLFLLEQYAFADSFYMFVLAFNAALLDGVTRKAREAREALSPGTADSADPAQEAPSTGTVDSASPAQDPAQAQDPREAVQ